MKRSPTRMLFVLGLLCGLSGQQANGRDSVLSVIPSDAVAFAVVHNLSDTSHDIGELAKLVKAPAPDLLSLAKGMTGLQKGLDEQGDLAIVVTGVDPGPKLIFLAPVEDFDDFFASLKVDDPTTGVAEVEIAGSSLLVGRKGTYAAIASLAQREALEKLIASTTNLADDTALAEWLDANRLSFQVTPQGIQQLVPKLLGGIRLAQEQIRRAGVPNGETTAEALSMYVDLFTAVEKEARQFGLGVRVDSVQTVDIATRTQLKEGGKWSTWAAKAQPATGDLLGGLEDKPLVAAFGGKIPPGATKELMKFSMKFMQNQPGAKFTPEQAQKYADLATEMMAGVRSMRMLMGVPEPGTGLYGNMSVLMIVDDSKGFFETYEKTLAGINELLKEATLPTMPVTTSKRIKLGDIEALEVSMKFPEPSTPVPPGMPDPRKLAQLFAGEDGQLKYYIAPADEHAVVTAYTSPDRLKEAIEFYKSQKPGLSANEGVAKVAAKLPPGSQVVAYMNGEGFIKTVKQVMAAAVTGPVPTIPDFPGSQPMGFAVKVSPDGIDGHMVVTAETLRSLGEVIAKTRAEAQRKRIEQQLQQ